MLPSMIVFSSVTKEYVGRAVVRDLSFKIQPGEFVCLTGPSGAGKSTIVHLLIRAECPTSGTIEVDGADLSMLPRQVLQMYRRKTGVLFQDYKLLSDRTVAENIAFALEVCDVPESDVAARVEELLQRLRLCDHADAFPHELSGGEKTRTALARALASRPSILIADEPTGNIDPDQSMEILELLKQVNAEGATVILASHDQRVVDSLGVRVLRLEQGTLVRDSVGGYNAPATIEPASAPKESVSPSSLPEPQMEPIADIEEKPVAVHQPKHAEHHHPHPGASHTPRHSVHHRKHDDEKPPITAKIKPIGI